VNNYSYIIEYDIFVFECIRCVDGVKVIMEPACRHLKPDMTYITSHRNVISTEHTASAIFVTFG